MICIALGGIFSKLLGIISLYIKGNLFFLKVVDCKTIEYTTDTVKSFSGIDNVSVLGIRS